MFIECLFNHGEILARDVVALDYVPKTRELLEEAERELSIGGPRYVVDVNVLFRDLLDLSRKLCGWRRRYVKSVVLGPEIDKLEKAEKNNLTYGIHENLMYLHDGVNHIFIDARGIDPFEVGEDNILIVYGVYGGRE